MLERPRAHYWTSPLRWHVKISFPIWFFFQSRWALRLTTPTMSSTRWWWLVLESGCHSRPAIASDSSTLRLGSCCKTSALGARWGAWLQVSGTGVQSPSGGMVDCLVVGMGILVLSRHFSTQKLGSYCMTSALGAQWGTTLQVSGTGVQNQSLEDGGIQACLVVGIVVWVSFKACDNIRLFHTETRELLQDISVGSPVGRMIALGAQWDWWQGFKTPVRSC